ncbi:unnamed protein product [Amoebophrya sp. A120]|nr:unnamed protein product [Amoebophrya sp. A120]|eukprot:GSA120T00005595001.1
MHSICFAFILIHARVAPGFKMRTHDKAVIRDSRGGLARGKHKHRRHGHHHTHSMKKPSTTQNVLVEPGSTNVVESHERTAVEQLPMHVEVHQAQHAADPRDVEVIDAKKQEKSDGMKALTSASALRSEPQTVFLEEPAQEGKDATRQRHSCNTGLMFAIPESLYPLQLYAEHAMSWLGKRLHFYIDNPEPANLSGPNAIEQASTTSSSKAWLKLLQQNRELKNSTLGSVADTCQAGTNSDTCSALCVDAYQSCLARTSSDKLEDLELVRNKIVSTANNSNSSTSANSSTTGSSSNAVTLWSSRNVDEEAGGPSDLSSSFSYLQRSQQEQPGVAAAGNATSAGAKDPKFYSGSPDELAEGQVCRLHSHECMSKLDTWKAGWNCSAALGLYNDILLTRDVTLQYGIECTAAASLMAIMLAVLCCGMPWTCLCVGCCVEQHRQRFRPELGTTRKLTQQQRRLEAEGEAAQPQDGTVVEGEIVEGVEEGEIEVTTTTTDPITGATLPKKIKMPANGDVLGQELFIRQKVTAYDFVELLCGLEMGNKYELYPVKDDKNLPMMHIDERGTNWCQRICCGTIRGLTFDVFYGRPQLVMAPVIAQAGPVIPGLNDEKNRDDAKNAPGVPLLEIKKGISCQGLACLCCYCGPQCCTACCRPKIHVHATEHAVGGRRKIGYVQDHNRFCGSRQEVYLGANDDAATHTFTVEGSSCQLGALCCAGFEAKYAIKEAGSNKEVGLLKKEAVTGTQLLLEFVADAQIFRVTPPDPVTLDEKAMLLAAAMMVELQYYEGQNGAANVATPGFMD